MWRITQPMVDYLKQKKLPMLAKFHEYWDRCDKLLFKQGISLYHISSVQDWLRHPDCTYVDDDSQNGWYLKIDGTTIFGDIKTVGTALEERKLLTKGHSIFSLYDREFTTTVYRITINENIWFEFSGFVRADELRIAGNLFGTDIPDDMKHFDLIPETYHIDLIKDENFENGMAQEIDTILKIQHAADVYQKKNLTSLNSHRVIVQM